MASRSCILNTMIGKEYSCNDCNKVYNNRKGIDLHMRVSHNSFLTPVDNILPHRCEWCKNVLKQQNK